MTNAQYAHLLLRIVLGVNIAAHGMSRLAHTGTFADKLVSDFAQTPLPAWSVSAFAHVVPFAELAIGLCILLGFFLRESLFAGGLLIAALTLGSCLAQMWEAAGSQLLYAAVYAVLLHGAGQARFTLTGIHS